MGSIENLPGFFMAGIAPLYLAMIPVASSLTKPGSIVEGLLEVVQKSIMDSSAYPNRAIPAMTALYLFWTFGATAGFSVAGQAASRPEGLDLHHPRKHLGNMRGLPLRLRSAHSSLMEGFAGFAAAAGLAQMLDSDNRQIVNLLGLHVLLKVFVYYPSYVLNVPPVRTISHVLAISAIIDVCRKLATGC